jgi:hypothetical protein
LLLLAGTAAWATPLNFSMSGTFNAGTSVTPYFGPNETWSLSLSLDSNPAVVSDFIGQFTQVTISNVVYLVDGVETYAGDNSVFFYATPFYSGGFDICLDSNCSFGLAANVGVQMYSGPNSEASPTFAPAVYTTTVFDAYYFPVGQGTTIESPQTNIPVTISAATPEPSSVLLSLLGLVALSLLAVKRQGRLRSR